MFKKPVQEGDGCAYRRIRPGILSEAGRLYRLKPAGHSDDAGHLIGRGPRVGVCIRSVIALAIKLLTFGGGFTKTFALEREPMGIVHEAIENGIGDGGIADDLVPVLDGELAGYDGRAAAVAILHDLQHCR